MKLKQIFGISGVIAFFAIIFVVSTLFVRNFGFITSDPQKVRNEIQGYGFTAYLIYFFLYIFQIFFAPVPGQVLNVASGMLFGPLKGFLVSWSAVITGGLFAMLVSRFFGKKILYLFVEERALAFEHEITKRGLPLILFLAILPNPVGDGLFYLAGLTTVPLKILIVLIAICRIPGILIYVIAGDKIMVLGIKGWIIGGIGFLIALILYFTLRKKMEKLFEVYIKKLDLSGAKS
ncbi:MAG: VTT domain-containing protein [candidate division WOR-3 bacterium]|nr:VTT domain-containing protein [candidate division WOR-3 bacterium]